MSPRACLPHSAECMAKAAVPAVVLGLAPRMCQGQGNFAVAHARRFGLRPQQLREASKASSGLAGGAPALLCLAAMCADVAALVSLLPLLKMCCHWRLVATRHAPCCRSKLRAAGCGGHWRGAWAHVALRAREMSSFSPLLMGWAIESLSPSLSDAASSFPPPAAAVFQVGKVKRVNAASQVPSKGFAAVLSGDLRHVSAGSHSLLVAPRPTSRDRARSERSLVCEAPCREPLHPCRQQPFLVFQPPQDCAARLRPIASPPLLSFAPEPLALVKHKSGAHPGAFPIRIQGEAARVDA